MRARVLGRARSITRRRLMPVVAALLLASAAAVHGLTSHDESSARLWVTDSDKHQTEGDAVVPAAPAVGESSAPADQGGPAAAQARRPAVGTPAVSAPVVGKGPALATRGPLLGDAAGDAFYPATCVNNDCVGVSDRRSQAAADLTDVDIRVHGNLLRATFRLQDLSMPPDSDPSTVSQPDYSWYRLLLHHDGVVIELDGAHFLTDRRVRSTGTIWRGETERLAEFGGVTSTLDQAANTVVVEVVLPTVSDALVGIGRAAVRVGTLVRPEFWSGFGNSATEMTVLVDTAQHEAEEYRYRLGD